LGESTEESGENGVSGNPSRHFDQGMMGLFRSYCRVDREDSVIATLLRLKYQKTYVYPTENNTNKLINSDMAF
jgi:hypothetical protein